jgi:hypothetical protein
MGRFGRQCCGGNVSSGEITETVERFIQDHIQSVEQLEVLLLLSSAPDKEWTATEVSQNLYRQPESIESRLDDLHARGLLLVRPNAEQPEKGPRYHINTASRDLQTIKELEVAYRVRKDAVIRLIFAKPQDNLRVFSDAFRIRRRD